MNTFLLVHTTKADGKRWGPDHVQEYSPADMDELFTVHERLWLSQGKIVERTDRTQITTRYVDMVVAASRTLSI